MSELTDAQIEFANRMSERQWMVLGSLIVPYYLSASERADRELWALVEHGLATCYSDRRRRRELYIWHATEVGVALVRAHFHRKKARVLPDARHAARPGQPEKTPAAKMKI
ncbi:MAG: hypothetical protein EKK40_08085 [Bradyrhizobiaceae bacterium]|nr:MAG: hypothetical protein EKK40_08085 [Bradyrhizobiaceae bacterium]